MKRATRTKLKILQKAPAVPLGEIPEPFGLDEILREEREAERKRKLDEEQFREDKLIIPETQTTDYIFDKTIIVDSPEKKNMLSSLTASDVKGVERLIVRRLYPEIFDQRFNLKKRFFQDPSVIYKSDTDIAKDKELKEIVAAFENFWFREMKLQIFPEGTTLELEDCFIRPSMHMVDTFFDTLIVNYTDDMVSKVKLPILSLNPPAETRLERIVVGMNVVINCNRLNIDTLVCMNILSYGDTLTNAENISKLIILTELNPTRDADPERGDIVPRFPLHKTMHTLWFPEAQEFEYKHYAILNSRLKYVGIIPSAYYPSRMSVGIQKTWQPIHREGLETEFLNLIRRA